MNKNIKELIENSKERMLSKGFLKMVYGYKKKTNLEFEQAVKKVREELKKEGFGVLTEIDVKKTLKEKLDAEYDDYVILGACNPSFAYKALLAEKDIGLLLSCNVIVYINNGETFVSAINPVEAMGMIENKELRVLKNLKFKTLKEGL